MVKQNTNILFIFTVCFINSPLSLSLSPITLISSFFYFFFFFFSSDSLIQSLPLTRPSLPFLFFFSLYFPLNQGFDVVVYGFDVMELMGLMWAWCGGKDASMVADAVACSWVSSMVCSDKIGMGMVMDLVVSFSIFAVCGGGGFPWWWGWVIDGGGG